MATITKREGVNGTTHHVKIRLRGHPPQSASFERLTDARRWAASTESAIREGRHFKTNEARRHTFADAVRRYAAEKAPELPKEWKHREAHLAWWSAHIGAYALSELTPALLTECKARLSAGQLADGSQGPKRRANATVVRYLAALSHCLGVCVREWEWLESNPVEKVSNPPLPRGRVRFLSDDERDALLSACQQSESRMLYPAVVLAMSSGFRWGELVGLRWVDIDLARGRGTLHETKNGEVRVVAIAGPGLDLLRAMSKVRRIDTGYIFPSKTGKAPCDLRTPWRTAVKRAGLTDFKRHDLRHTCASYLAMSGASMLEIAAVLGHKTLQMVQRYSHLSEDHTNEVVARMNAKMFR